jgi:hypothetical protein
MSLSATPGVWLATPPRANAGWTRATPSSMSNDWSEGSSRSPQFRLTWNTCPSRCDLFLFAYFLVYSLFFNTVALLSGNGIDYWKSKFTVGAA